MSPTVYPLNAVLIGVSDPVTPHLRHVLDARQAAVEADLPTADDAVTRYGQAKEPRLLVVFAPQGIAPVSRLRTVFAGWPILALVEPDCDPAALLALNRGGADQVVALPLNEADFTAALDQIGQRFRPATTERPKQTVALTGTVPGAGVSTLSANLAAEIAFGHHTEVVLVEAALQMGVLAINLNAKPAITLVDLLTEPDHLDAEQVRKALVRVAPGFHLLAAPPDVTRPGPGAPAAVVKALEVARQLVNVVVVDVPCGYDDFHFETLWAADQVVIVGDQTMPSVRNCRMVLDAVDRVRPPKRVHVVLNRYDPAIFGVTSADVSRALGGAAVRTVPNDHHAVMQAAADGLLLRVSDPHSPVLAAVRDLARAVVGPPATPATHDRTLLSRVFDIISHGVA